VPDARITVTSQKKENFKANLDFNSVEVVHDATTVPSAGVAQYANNMYLDNENIIWDRLPNGVPYIVGYRQKIK
jgi:hypothetical protein